MISTGNPKTSWKLCLFVKTQPKPKHRHGAGLDLVAGLHVAVSENNSSRVDPSLNEVSNSAGHTALSTSRGMESSDEDLLVPERRPFNVSVRGLGGVFFEATGAVNQTILGQRVHVITISAHASILGQGSGG